MAGWMVGSWLPLIHTGGATGEVARLDAILANHPPDLILQPNLVAVEWQHPVADVDEYLHALAQRGPWPSGEFEDLLTPSQSLDDPLDIQLTLGHVSGKDRGQDAPCPPRDEE